MLFFGYWRLAQAASLILFCSLSWASPAPPVLSSVNWAAENFLSQHPKIQPMFQKALLDTAHQISIEKDGTVYVKTGDIPAMWLRDSSAQIQPYLFFAKADPEVAKLIKGVVQRQAKSLVIDPYANAFRVDYSIWERKFELDSLCYPILLSWSYWKMTGDESIFTSEVKKGFAKAFETMKIEQDHLGQLNPKRKSEYKFKSDTQEAGLNPVAYTGMIWTGFRPSDDPSKYNFLIPAQMHAVQALAALAEIERTVFKDEPAAKAALKMRDEVHLGIQRFGIVRDRKGRAVYAYEVDGKGNHLLMDDANLPSLISAPYFGYGKSTDVVYKNTRALILSKENPFFYSGKLGSGVGSPHTPPGMIWPLGLIAQGLTTLETKAGEKEKQRVLNMLLASDPGDLRLHESFHPDDPKKLTRQDFGWPNALMAEFVMTRVGHLKPIPTPSTQDLKFLTAPTKAPEPLHLTQSEE